MIAGLHIEPTNLCTLKCAGCARTRFIEQWPQHWHNYNLDIDLVLKFLDIDLTGLPIILCGNYGDPIYHPDFIDFVTKLKKRGAYLQITTNGSYKTVGWWEELTTLLDTNDTITFSIDGTPENFLQYRVNADWASIRLAMGVCVKSQCNTVWKYIPFRFNQDTIDAARFLSQTIGIDEFKIHPSNRFDEQTKNLLPDIKYIRNTYQPQLEWKSSRSVTGIDPLCKTNQEHFITADGYYSPCCRVADYRFYYKTQFGKDKKFYCIQNTTLTTLLMQPKVINFYNKLEEQPGCQYNCPKIS